MSSDFCLRAGTSLPWALVHQMLALADRGHEFTLQPDGRVAVVPSLPAGAPEALLLRHHALDLRRAVAYLDTIAQSPIDEVTAPWRVPA